MNIISSNFMTDLFLVFVDKNFIHRSFYIDFCIKTRTWAEHLKLSNQALDWMTFTTPFSNVPIDKLHP